MVCRTETEEETKEILSQFNSNAAGKLNGGGVIFSTFQYE